MRVVWDAAATRAADGRRRASRVCISPGIADGSDLGRHAVGGADVEPSAMPIEGWSPTRRRLAYCGRARTRFRGAFEDFPGAFPPTSVPCACLPAPRVPRDQARLARALVFRGPGCVHVESPGSERARRTRPYKRPPRPFFVRCALMSSSEPPRQKGAHQSFFTSPARRRALAGVLRSRNALSSGQQ